MPLGRPLTFNDELSVSGTLTLKKIDLRGVGYIGFFNSRRHTWRVWSSMAFRIWEENDEGQVMFDWMSSDWRARGVETAIMLKPSDKPHTWSFRYEPEARADPVWHDKDLERHVTSQTGNGRPYELQGEEHLLERMRKENPSLTREDLHARLLKARDQGLVEYFQRHGQHRWWKRPDAGNGHGRVTLRFDDETPYVFWFDSEIRQAPAEFDRFGLFNIARFGRNVELYLGDLTVNGQKIDLSQDPRWEGRNNESQYVEPNFQAMQSYGWSQTNWAGSRIGEIGGLFWRTEAQDPAFSYYADDIGALTLDDPISFSGSIRFTEGMTDAGAYFGYFKRDDQLKRYDKPGTAVPLANSMGISISDRSAIGYYFMSHVTSGDRESARENCGIFVPDGRQHRFAFDYDPKGNGGVGVVTVSLDGEKHTLKLKPEQRKARATFDRFGLANVRDGGHSVEFYLDDLVYTARRSSGSRPQRKPQTSIEVSYPHKQAGRRY